METIITNYNKKNNILLNTNLDKDLKKEKTIDVMKRYEYKYILNEEQTSYLKEMIKSHMILDEYGLTSIQSLYFDTPDFRLVRNSLEKPMFKEKMRLRSYGLAKNYTNVFLELKRKYDGIVYKRRIKSKIDLVNSFLNYDSEINDTQIEKEITYFRNYYENLIPSCLIIYDRLAYFEENGDLRLTIDHSPRYRFDNLNLTSSLNGSLLLKPGYTILEIKVQDSMPLWLTKILNDAKIYKSSFSKYGGAYLEYMKNRIN